MDTTKLLEADHNTAASLFEQIDKAEGDARSPLIKELETALTAHVELEERVLYPAMKPVTGDEPVQEANTEHELARKTMAEMVNLAPDQPGFGAALEALKAGIEHHVEEEETEVFPKLRSDGEAVLRDIAAPMVRTRIELGLPMDAAALASAATKDELVSGAEDVGIDGAAAMNKDELADAVLAKLTA